MNAIVGDNGIITQAQNANIQSGIAVLEEYLQEEYVRNYDELSEKDSKIIGLMNIYPEYFYIPANEGIGALRYIVDSEGHALYLIKKSGLPEEIREQLAGGEAGEKTYADYAGLNDVYGVTSNLKVYYCSGEKDNTGSNIFLGVTVDDIENENPNRIVFNDTSSGIGSSLKDFDSNGDGQLQYSEILGIKQLTITNDNTNLTNLYNLVNLSELILDNVNISTLQGIENCSKLSYIFIKNSTIGDYSSMGKLGSRLTHLYFLDATNEEVSKLGIGLSNYDLPKLEYLGFFHIYSANVEYYFYTTTNRTVNDTVSNLTDISGLSNFSTTTKNAVKYLYINDNQITSLEPLSDFNNIYYLRAQNNKVTTLKGLENKNNLTYACIKTNSLTDTEEVNSLQALSQNKKVYWLDLANNSNIKRITYLVNCTNLKYLYLDGLNSIEDMGEVEVGNLIRKLTETVYGSRYSLDLIDTNLTKKLDLSSTTITENQFKTKIGQCKNLTYLDLSNVIFVDNNNNPITDDNLNVLLNDVLSQLTLLRELALYNVKFSDFRFITKLTKMQMLDLRNTNVTTAGDKGLKLLENITTIGVLALNVSGTNLSEIPLTLKRLANSSIGTGVEGKQSHIFASHASRFDLFEYCSNKDS